jgi:hypothetical protein
VGITRAKKPTFGQQIDIQILRQLIPQHRVSGSSPIPDFTTCYWNYHVRIFADYSAGTDSVDWGCHVEFFQQSIQKHFQSQAFLESHIFFRSRMAQ